MSMTRLLWRRTHPTSRHPFWTTLNCAHPIRLNLLATVSWYILKIKRPFYPRNVQTFFDSQHALCEIFYGTGSLRKAIRSISTSYADMTDAEIPVARVKQVREYDWSIGFSSFLFNYFQFQIAIADHRAFRSSATASASKQEGPLAQI